MGNASSKTARGDFDPMTSGYSKSAPTQDGTNRFLQLPGEIRNTIYEYALTANHHELFYRDSIDFDSIPQPVTEEVNSIDDIWHATPQECVDAYYEQESAQGIIPSDDNDSNSDKSSDDDDDDDDNDNKFKELSNDKDSNDETNDQSTQINVPPTQTNPTPTQADSPTTQAVFYRRIYVRVQPA